MSEVAKMPGMPDRSVLPPTHPLQVPAPPPVERCTLSNGVELVSLNHGLQPVNRVVVSWPIGMADVKTPEALHLLRAMLTEGTGTLSGNEVSDIFEFNGAWIRVETGNHSTAVTLYSLNRSVNDVVPLLGDIISAPAFPAEALERIREKEASECGLNRRKVATRASELGRQMLYGADHPLARVLTPEKLAAVERADLVNLHAALLSSCRPTVYLAGALDSNVMDTVVKMAESYSFDPQTSADVLLAEKPLVTPVASDLQVYRDESSMQTAVRMSLPAVSRNHPDYERLRYVVFAIGGYFGSRLMSNIREDKGYTYGINAGLTSLPEEAHVSITCQTDNRYAEAVLNEISNEIGRIATEPMEPQELEIVKSTVMSGLASMLDSPFSIIDYQRVLDSFKLPADYFMHQVNELAALTPENVMECAARHLASAPRLTALAGNPASI